MINEKIARKYCKDDISKIENYEKAVNDLTQTWVCHHRLGLTREGQPALTKKELMRQDIYFHRSPEELIFLTRAEHMSLHNKGKKLSDETRKKLSVALKNRVVSDDTRKKISESCKGKQFTAEHRQKLSVAKKDKSFSVEHRKHMSVALKNRVVSDDTRKKMSESHTGEKNPMYGRHPSATAIKKHSESMKAYWRRRKLELGKSDKEDEDIVK